MSRCCAGVRRSAAVQVTVVTPIGNRLSEAGVQVTGREPSTASCASPRSDRYAGPTAGVRYRRSGDDRHHWRRRVDDADCDRAGGTGAEHILCRAAQGRAPERERRPRPRRDGRIGAGAASRAGRLRRRGRRPAASCRAPVSTAGRSVRAGHRRRRSAWVRAVRQVANSAPSAGDSQNRGHECGAVSSLLQVRRRRGSPTALLELRWCTCSGRRRPDRSGGG